MKMDPYLRAVEFRPVVVQLSISIAQSLEHERQFTPEDHITPTCRAEHQTTTDVAVRVQRWALLSILSLAQDFISHQPGVPSRYLNIIVLRSNGKVQIASCVGMSQRVAARYDRPLGRQAQPKLDVNLIGVETSHPGTPAMDSIAPWLRLIIVHDSRTSLRPFQVALPRSVMAMERKATTSVRRIVAG